MAKGRRFQRFRRGFGRPPKVTKRVGREVKYSILGYDRVWFTKHAHERDVFAVLENPSQEGLPTAPNRERWRLFRPGKKSIDVVFHRNWPDKLAIITVMKV